MAARHPSHMGDLDVRMLTIIIDDIYGNLNWQPSRKIRRVMMLLHLYATLGQEDDDAYPTVMLSVSELANAAGCKYALAHVFVSWLLNARYLVMVGDGGNEKMAFSWHVEEAERGGGDD